MYSRSITMTKHAEKLAAISLDFFHADRAIGPLKHIIIAYIIKAERKQKIAIFFNVRILFHS